MKAVGQGGKALKENLQNNSWNPTPKNNSEEFIKLKNWQWYKDENGLIWKKDMLHKDHWDISHPKTWDKVKEVDFFWNELWPNWPENKNKLP